MFMRKTVTKEDIERSFNEYNQLYFDGELGKCRLSCPNMIDFGAYYYNAKKKDKVKSQIMIARNVNWTETALRDTIIHEMIHMYVRTVRGKRIDGLLGHGWAFRRECRRIKRNFGITITIHGFEIEDLRKGPSTKLWEKVLLCIIDGGY